jgi:regulator of RNase E activity RraA
MCLRYRRLYGGPIYDVMEKMGYPDQVLSHEIRPLLPHMKIAGPAYTLKGDREHPKQTRFTKIDLLEGLKKHYVCIYAAGDDESGHWGELTSNGAACIGAQGIVVDGGARDSSMHIKIPNWNTFCRYTSPIEAGPRAGIVAQNEPILMAGTLTEFVGVRPKDFVFGDLDGVIIIPQDIALDVLIEAEKVVDSETKGRALLWKGKSLKQVGKQLGVG